MHEGWRERRPPGFPEIPLLLFSLPLSNFGAVSATVESVEEPRLTHDIFNGHTTRCQRANAKSTNTGYDAGKY